MAAYREAGRASSAGDPDGVGLLFRETVSTLGGLANLRDPWTARHQRRVGDLSRAIGLQLRLDAEQVESLSVCGQLHDIGKIGTPAEILNKPSGLTTAEFALMKEHAADGWRALAPMSLPCPFAVVAHQHHERLDGSGYPLGLKGDQIILEAQVVAVADVVEAMSATRSYRAGLGIERALEEIRAGSGLRYQPDAARACAALFETAQFAWDDAV
jgi:HD-GYP domain-containing protein (c-di-GMP phosphodiesterase class II)